MWATNGTGTPNGEGTMERRPKRRTPRLVTAGAVVFLVSFGGMVAVMSRAFDLGAAGGSDADVRAAIDVAFHPAFNYGLAAGLLLILVGLVTARRGRTP
ncbi:MAG: hypothetical protein JWO31_418 [Phycisphaerales bacterium]|nr:hypothetical protein [Phycisphaerales bacterium]